MTLFFAALVRRTKTDGCLAADNRRLVSYRARFFDSRLDGIRIVAINIWNNMPAISLETARRIIGEPAFDFTIDRDVVVIVHRDQLAKAQRAGKRA